MTLFGVHPDDLKACVYEMRFDEASAHYAEFGPFWTGMVGRDRGRARQCRLAPPAHARGRRAGRRRARPPGSWRCRAPRSPRLGRAVVAFSGGADSALVARVATEVLGPDRVLCVTAVSRLWRPRSSPTAGPWRGEWGLRWRTVSHRRARRPRLRGQRRRPLLPLQGEPPRPPWPRWRAPSRPSSCWG